MKHNVKITLILLGMFLLAQLIGLYVISSYTTQELPYGMQPPEIEPQVSIINIVIAMVIAIFLIFLLMKIKASFLIRIWFFIVVTVALSITLNSVLSNFHLISFPTSLIAVIIALPLAIYKIFKRNILIHNLTELLIYPGIASIFVPILNLWAVILLLLLISIYDIYAVWHSGFMQKMAKFQIEKVRVFAGFFLPYLTKKQKDKIKLLRQKYKEKKFKNSKQKLIATKIKVNLAILGGGDVVFPIIMAGVVLRTISLGILPALFVSLFATLALFLLQIAAKKGKFYPAMPFITAGCLLGLVVGYLIRLV